MKGFKFIETLEVTFEKDTIDSKTGKRVSIYKTAFFNSKAKTITKANDIEHELSMSRQEILNVIDKSVSEGSGWVIDRIGSHYMNVTTYTPLHGPYNIGMEKKGLKKYDYNVDMDMEKKDLKKFTKGQLIELLLKLKKSKKVSNPEDLLDNNPFKDEVAQEPAKRIKPPKPTRKPPPIPQVEDHIINVPVPKIKKLNKALKGHAKSYGIELLDNLNPLNHFTKTRALVEITFEKPIERHERVQIH